MDMTNSYKIIYEGEIFLPEYYIPYISSLLVSPQPLFSNKRIKGYEVIIEFEGGKKFRGTGFTREEAIYNAVAYAHTFLKIS